MAVDVGAIIARLVLDRTEFSRSLADARAEAEAFPDVRVGLDTSRFDAEWARVRAMIAGLAGGENSSAGLDIGRFTSAAATVEAMKAALSRGVDIPVRYALDSSGLILPREVARRSVTAPLVESALASGAAGGGGGRRVDVFYHASGEGKGGGGLGFGGVASSLLFGGGSKLPFFGTLAGLGSLASFAGLGPEHAIMTLVGLAGSAAGGALGGGLLGLGSLGKFAVGSGSDAAVMKSTITDTKTLYTDLNNLSAAVTQYGAKSKQAQQATAQLNADMKGLGNTAGVQAELGLAKAAVSLNTFWDQATSSARVQAVRVLDQVLQLGRTYVPLVAQAAYANLGVINTTIKPLFAWLEGPQGMGIFKNLEREFITELPTAMQAFTNGVEFVIKTIDVASTYTGGFMRRLDEFLIRMNSPAGFTKWSAEIGKLISDFHLWEGLIVAVVKDVYLLFHQDAGTASGIVSSITEMLNRLGQWEASTRGSAQLHSIFEIHKQEILELLQILPALVGSFGHIYLTVAPALTGAFVTVLKAVVPLINALAKNPFGAWVLGLGLIASRLGLLSPLLAPITGGFVNLGKSLAASALSTAGLDGLAAKLGATATKAEGAAAAASTIGSDAAAASEVGSVSLMGLLGPIGLVAGAAAGVAAIWVAFEKHAPSALSLSNQGLTNMNGLLKTLPVGNLDQMQEALLNVKQYLATTVQDMKDSKPASAGLETAAGAAEALYSAQQKLSIQSGILRSNTDLLAKSFGISTGNVATFAQEAGINLTRALRPGDIQIFKQAIETSGQTFDTAAPKATNFAQKIADASQKAVSSIENMNGQTTALMDTYKSIMGGGSVIAMADFINGQAGGLPRVLANAQQWGIHIPSQYQNLLLRSMTSTGQISMQNLSSGMQATYGAVAGSLANINFKIVAGFHLPKDFTGIGKASMEGLNAGAASVDTPNYLGNLAAKAAQIVRNRLGIKSPSTVFYEIGANMMQGLLNAFAAHEGQVIGTMGSIVGGSTALAVGGFAQIQALGQQMAAAAGWTGPQWAAFNAVVMRESGWNPAAVNPTSGAAGIAQNIGGFGAYPNMSPAGQIAWMINYIQSRYGTPEAAWAHEVQFGWYAGGTPFAPGGMGVVGEQGPELMFVPRGSQIFNNRQTERMLGGVNFTSSHSINVSVNGGDPATVKAAVCKALDQHDRELMDALQQLAGATA